MKAQTWWESLPANRQQTLYARYFPGSYNTSLPISRKEIKAIFEDQTIEISNC